MDLINFKKTKSKMNKMIGNVINVQDIASDLVFYRCPHIRDCKNCPAYDTKYCKFHKSGPEVPTYESIILGPCSGYDSNRIYKEGDLIEIPLTGKGTFILLSGDTGAGKSVLLRRIIDTLYVKKQQVMVVFDPKNQYKSSTEPNKVQTKRFRGKTKYLTVGHLHGEKMYGLKMKFYIPKYVEVALKGHLPDDVADYDLLSFPYRFFSAGDLLQLMEGMKRTHYSVLTKAVNNANKKNEKYKLEDLIFEIEEMDKIQKATKDMIIRGLETLQILGLADDDCKEDVFFEDMKNGYIPVVVYSHGAFFKSNSTLLDGLVDSQLNYIYQKQASNPNPLPLWFILDEARHLLPKKKNTPSKDTIQNILTMGRSAMMNLILGIQNIKQIDQDIARADFNNYLTFKPNEKEIQDFWKEKLRGHPAFRYSLEKLRTMKFKTNSMNECALIDTNGRMVTFYPLMSLSKHHD